MDQITPRRAPYKFAAFKVTDADAPLIAKLKPEYQQILAAEGSTAQVAKALNVREGTVKSRRNRAREALVALRAQAV